MYLCLISCWCCTLKTRAKQRETSAHSSHFSNLIVGMDMMLLQHMEYTYAYDTNLTYRLPFGPHTDVSHA
ncbi:hypothetical protein L596_005851 [Steinernema carpocapsae]|uniref:Uncharacterized protein n=1 Tax=Steinernema carpocapsae TaxID=34508 RepID=A0A4V6I8U8_STECR|nr:hypothetical protein L596_005851 [Steinernema carpocapsae]